MFTRSQIPRAVAFTLIVALVFCPTAVRARNDKNNKKVSPASNSLDDYLKRVRAAGVEQPGTLGSLWISSGPLASWSGDYKARLAGDLITVQLVDTFSAATSGENQTSRQFSTNSDGIQTLPRHGRQERRRTEEGARCGEARRRVRARPSEVARHRNRETPVVRETDASARG